MIKGLEKKIKKNIIQITLILGIILLVLVDQFTKLLFKNKVYFENSIISIKYSQNLGSSLSMFSNINNYSFYLSIISIIILIGIFYLFNEFSKDKIDRLILIFFTSGLIGNTIDRLLTGHVIDFISIKYFFILNIADIYLSIAFILIVYIHIYKK